MAGSTDLQLACVELLDAVDAALATTAGGAVARSYVSPGPPAFDCCDQVTVHAGGAQRADTQPLTPGLQPGFSDVDAGVMPLVELTATVVRCVPVMDENGNPPAAADMEAAAALLNEDVWAVIHHLTCAHRAGALFAGLSGPREMFVGPAFPLDPSGGCGGWEIPVRVTLPGYACA